MTAIQIYGHMTVQLIDSMGGDDSIIQAARVSVAGSNDVDDGAVINAEKSAGLINYLMRKKHGSPFEHTALKFYVKAPIFVFREMHRHRIGFSYNEMSGRYTQLLPEFYEPTPERNLVNIGTSANPKFDRGTQKQRDLMDVNLRLAYRAAWNCYENMLDAGIGNEVARLCLPVGIYSQQYVTCNARSLMNFLSLRTANPLATFPSNPQREIEMVAKQMEAIFAEKFPITYAKFNDNGRVAP